MSEKAAGGQFAALFQGVCSGHGKGSPMSPIWATISPCAGGNIEPIPARPYDSGHDLAGEWMPKEQLPRVAGLATSVVINGITPIVDGDELTLHPTNSAYMVIRTEGKCTIRQEANAWWCHTYSGFGSSSGREPSEGHARKCFATCRSVLINGKFAGRIGDPLGDKSNMYPCRSVIAGGSTNVMIGL